MQLLFKNHTQIANKWLVLLSGLNKNALIIDGKKVYEKHYFNLPKEWTEIRWSKTLIKQVLAYAGLSNSEGNLGIVDLEELAEVLNCSIRSIKNNNKTLQKIGLVEVEDLYGDYVHIKLLNYVKNFLDLYEIKHNEEEKYKSGRGYTTIKREALFKLFSIKNVNVLRIACRAFYLNEKEVNLAGNNSVLLTSNVLKGFLPAYFSYKPVIQRAIRPLYTLFDVSFLDVKEDKGQLLKEHKATPFLIEKFKAPYMLSLKLHKVLNSRLVQMDESIVSNPDITGIYNKTGMNIPDYDSMNELIAEYGKTPVFEALSDIHAFYQERMDLATEKLSSVLNEVKSLKWNESPIGAFRKIFKKYALSYQEGYFVKL